MGNREKAIKAFFDDEKNIKAIASDEEFINKVSGGEAKPETYKEEFKKFGLDLTDEEAAQTAEMINEIRSTPDEKLPEKLNDLLLGDISGGEEGEFTPEQNYNPDIQCRMEREAQRRTERGLIVGGSIAGGIVTAGLLAGLVYSFCFTIKDLVKAEDEDEAHKAEAIAKYLSKNSPYYRHIFKGAMR